MQNGIVTLEAVWQLLVKSEHTEKTGCISLTFPLKKAHSHIKAFFFFFKHAESFSRNYKHVKSLAGEGTNYSVSIPQKMLSWETRIKY